MISEIAQVRPTKIEIKGEQVYYKTQKAMHFENGKWTELKREENAWIYELPLFHGYYLERHYKKLMQVIHNPKQLGEYCFDNQIKAKLFTVIESDKLSFPSISLSNDFIQFLSCLRATLEPDIYII